MAIASRPLSPGNASLADCFEALEDIGTNTRFTDHYRTHAVWWDLVQRARRGDRKAFDAFLAGVTRQFWPQIYREFDPDIHRAQDVLNEVLTNLVAGIDNLADDDIPSYIAAFVRGRMLEARRRVRFQNSLTDQSAEAHRRIAGLVDPAPHPLQSFITADEIAELRQALSLLDPRTRYVVERHEGLNGNDPATLKEIGKEEGFGVTGKRVQQIHAKGMHQLGVYLRALQHISFDTLVARLEKTPDTENAFDPLSPPTPTKWKHPALKRVLFSIREKIIHLQRVAVSTNTLKPLFTEGLEKLPSPQKDILKGLYVRNQPMSEIAADLNLSEAEAGSLGRTALDEVKLRIASNRQKPSSLRETARPQPKGVSPLSPQQEKQKWEEALARFFSPQGLSAQLEARIAELYDQEVKSARPSPASPQWLTVVLNPKVDAWSAAQGVGAYLDKRAPNLASALLLHGQAQFSSPVSGGFTNWLRRLASQPEVQVIDIGDGDVSTLLARLDLPTRKWFLESAADGEKAQPTWLRVMFRRGVNPRAQLRKNLASEIESLDIEVDPSRASPQTLRVRATAAGVLAILMRPHVQALSLE